MSCFIFANDRENDGKIDIDGLYDKAQKRDLKQLSIFNKLLNRIHTRIRLTGRNKCEDKHIWYTVPEYIFGEPIYNQGDCIGYLVVKLEENGFDVRYMHPNTLFVSWNKWVPSYVRSEIKRKTGKVIDEGGNLIRNNEDDEDDNPNSTDPNSSLFNNRNSNNNKPQKQYTPINNYKPSGNLVYGNDLLEEIDKKINL
jgi:hypothetical protein